MKEMTLKGSSDIKYRFDFLMALFNQANDIMKHIDDRRQTSLNYALAIFAGLLGLAIGINNLIYRLYITIALSLIMLIFCMWDRRLHKANHGVQASLRTYREKIQELINNPSKDLEFPTYRLDHEKDAEWFSFLPIIYYVLIVSAVLASLVFYYL
jgi:hypothetical protein